jgi:hypothetical protein
MERTNVIPISGTMDFEEYPSIDDNPDDNVYNYTQHNNRIVAAPKNFSWMTLTVIPKHSGATTDQIDNRVQKQSSELSAGDNTVTFIVTAEDGIATATYNFNVYVEPRTDATLKSITVNPGALSTAFAANTVSYSVFVDGTVPSVTLTAETNDSAATLVAKLSGEAPAPADGDTEQKKTLAVPLSQDTPVNVSFEVTAEDGATKKIYTVTLLSTNAAPDGAWDNLTIMSGWLALQPANTPETPYNVILSSGAIIFLGLSGGTNKPLANLMTALNNAKRYVTLDLSAFTDTPGGRRRQHCCRRQGLPCGDKPPARHDGDSQLFLRRLCQPQDL